MRLHGDANILDSNPGIALIDETYLLWRVRLVFFYTHRQIIWMEVLSANHRPMVWRSAGIDALAAGVTFAFLEVKIIPAIMLIEHLGIVG